jgi:hypothetical protein
MAVTSWAIAKGFANMMLLGTLAAQERGEVKSNGGARNFTVTNRNSEPSAADIGLDRRLIHEARKIRDRPSRLIESNALSKYSSKIFKVFSSAFTYLCVNPPH